MEFLRGRLNGRLSSELFTYPELRSMFFTLILDQFFIFFIGVLSTAMVSSVGEAAIAAVSMVVSINSIVSLMFTSLAAGGGIVVARAKGSGDMDEIRRAIGEVTSLCVLVSIVLGGLLYVYAEAIVGLLYREVEPLVVEYAIRYMRLMCISFVPYSVFNAIFNIFRNLGDTKSSLMLTVVINVLHLILSLVFINVMNLGVTGSGLSYIVARVVGMLVALVWIMKVQNTYGVRLRNFFRFSRAVTRDIFSLGMPLSVESMLLQGGMLLVQLYLARLTTTDLAAHAVANSILMLYNTTTGALLSLTSTVCGQCYGAKRYDLVRRYGKNLIFVGRFALLATLLILYPFTPLLLKLYHATEQGRPIIYTALSIAVFSLPLFWCDGNIPSTVLRVAGDSIYTGVVSVCALLLCRCLAGYVLTIPLGLGVPGVWIALVLEWVVRAVCLHARMRGSRWLHIKPDKQG
ncbi:MAG: MATE family efflux transporter [Clostridia bacterium]|nr:MATE family efflux transporter [Clostridia bacterium]